MDYIKLNNGVEMPKVGLGTFLIPKDEIEKTICTAYDMGYRQFDTAWRYHNEGAVMQALRNHGVKREDVFITTKVNIDALYWGGYKYGKQRILNIRSKSIKNAIEESFQNLKTDYIDLFLVHWPWHTFIEMWKELEAFYKEGRIRAIGVSSFLPPHLESLQEISDVVPAVNQFEISPLNTQKRLIEYCKERNIAVEAMSTFSHFRSNEPRTEIIENPKLVEIGERHGKSAVQVVLRWMLQQGIIMIPKTWDEDKLKENISIFDFDLSTDEMRTIDSMDGGKFLNYNPYMATRGLPKKYKNWEGFNDPTQVPEWYWNRPKWKKVLLDGR